jgi:transcription initiation factor TFIIIB Brf1 subunit/transcription initiation factor TFIIB
LSKLAAASVFLACKLCNEQRRIRDVINIQHVLQMQECDGID